MGQPDPGEADPAVAELRERLRDLLKAIRLFKQAQPHIPAGMVSVLGTIHSLSTGGATTGGPTTGGPAGGSPAGAPITGEGERTTAGGCHGKDLAARSALDPSTVSRAGSALVRLGLVRRTADPSDGRASVLELSDHGHAALADIYRWYDDRLGEALAGWSPQELTAFGAMLRRFSNDVLTRLGNGLTDSTASPHSPSITEPQTTLEAAR